jgi:hypothetical protein
MRRILLDRNNAWGVRYAKSSRTDAAAKHFTGLLQSAGGRASAALTPATHSGEVTDMAFVHLTGWTAPDPLFFYNVHAAVGPGAPNRRDDVLLVQYFLHVIFHNTSAYNPPMTPIDGPDLAVSGVCDSTTAKWIMEFQKQGVARKKNIATDGVVDRATKSWIGTHSHTQYTITFLNFAYRTARPANYDFLPGAGDCPHDLAEALLH